MWKRFRRWLADNRDWNRQHRQAWSGVTSPGPGGLSVFQERCESALTREIRSAGLAIVERTIQPLERNETLLYIRLTPGDLDVWICSAGAQFGYRTGDVRLEEWDARTPDELISEVTAGVVKMARRQG